MQTKQTYSVYMHIFPNGKRYVGLTGQSVEQRWRKGNGYKKQKPIWDLICLYGWESIKHIILASNLDSETACELEKKYISMYDTLNPEHGVNTYIGGSVGPLGVKRSLETKKKLSESHKGIVTRKGFHLSEEQKEYLRKINLGKKLSEESKQKIREKNKNQKPTAFAIQRCKEVCNKRVMCIKTGEEFESATMAAEVSGEPRNTITRHCRNEVTIPRWKYL